MIWSEVCHCRVSWRLGLDERLRLVWLLSLLVCSILVLLVSSVLHLLCTTKDLVSQRISHGLKECSSLHAIVKMQK